MVILQKIPFLTPEPAARAGAIFFPPGWKTYGDVAVLGGIPSKLTLVFSPDFIDFISMVLYNILNIGTGRSLPFWRHPTEVSETEKEAISDKLNPQTAIYFI